MADAGQRNSDAARRRDHVAVLTQADQDPGLGVLVNSLIRNGFEGTLWVGWRGEGDRLFRELPAAVTNTIEVRLIELSTPRPLNYFKPDFLQQVWRAVEDEREAIVVYVDCDIAVGCEWDFIRAWCSRGLAFVEDLPGRPVGAEHPVRAAWKELMGLVGVQPVRELSRYFNSGFVGVPYAARGFLPVWSSLAVMLEGMPGLRAEGAEHHFVRGKRTQAPEALRMPDDISALMRPYFLEDQDAFNMALMGTDVAISAMGPDAMGFTPTRTAIVVHALGPRKPWSKAYIRDAIRRGEGPSFGDDMWWFYSDRPIQVARGLRFALRRLSWRIAKILNRVL